MKKINVGMLGIGNIGKGTYQTLELGRRRIEETTGLSIEITKILNRRPEVDRGIDIPKEKYTTNAYEIIQDPEIDIIIELIGGIEPATEYMAAALKAGKHVVTANKAAIAANGEMLEKIALENNVLLRFEASVAGGIPILNAIHGALMSNEFQQVSGILNGTTNYILTQMTEYGKDYNEVLKDAQAKGFAEADPTADVEGIDAANKLSILISLVFGLGISPEEIPTRGISKITSQDIEFAKDFGYKIKLLGNAQEENGAVSANVEPTLVPENHPLAGVGNEFNAVFLTGNAVDELMFYGRGAGPLPTGSAVMGDVISIARQIDRGAAFDQFPLLRYDADFSYVGEGHHSYYIRMTVKDVPGVLAFSSTCLAKEEISIQSVVQRGKASQDSGEISIFFIVYDVNRNVLDKAMEEITKDERILSIDNIFRVII